MISKGNYTLYMNHLLVVYAFLLPISERALSAIFSIILILFIVRGEYKYYLKNAIKNKILQACLLFFLVHIIWLFGTDDFDYAKTIIDDMKYLLFPIIFLSFVDKSFSIRIISAFILGMLFSEVLSYLIYFDVFPHMFELFDYQVYKTHSIGNPTPFLAHTRYNVLLSIVIAILMYNLLKNFRETPIFINLLATLFIFTASFNITIVAGRIGYISYILLMFFTLFLVYKKRIVRVLIPFSLVLFSLLYLSYQSDGMLTKRIDQTIDSTKKIFSENPDFNSSIGYRISFWISSVDVIKNNFIFGVGTGDHMNSVRLSEKDAERKEILYYLSNSHNEYLKALLQFGIVGFLFFINIFYQIFKQNTINEIDINILYIITIGILIGVISSMFGSKIYLPFLMLMASVITSKNSFLVNTESKISFKMIFYYMSFALISFIFAIIQ